jgi:hypothetical protein
MANSITNTQLTQKYIQMSNGLTSVFFETFCLAGASMATQKYEKDLLIWFDFNEKIKQYERCFTHTIYMHFGGCMICNQLSDKIK